MSVPVRGEPFEVPKGVPVHSMGTGRWHVSKRKQTVWPFSVARYDDWTVVTWPGSGGYWRRVAFNGDQWADKWPHTDLPTWRSIDAHEVVA